MNKSRIVLSILLLLNSYALSDSIPNYRNTCAAKLFSEPHYNEILNSGSPLVDQVLADYKEHGWPPAWQFSVSNEHRHAKGFLTYLTNSYPHSVAAFIPDDCNTNAAQAVWASVLENYQDGGSRLVIPSDIRELVFMCDVVIPIGIEGTNNLEKFQYADAKMVHTGTRLVLESVRNWKGNLALVESLNSDFSRVAHKAFWNMLVTYVGIIKYYEPDYAYNYLADIILCRQENLSRWLWDANYCAEIRSTYAPDLTDPFWFEPQKYIPVLIEWDFPEKVPDILKMTGNALIELTDRIIQHGIPADDENAKSSIQLITSYIRGAASSGGSENEFSGDSVPYQDAQYFPALESSDEYDVLSKKWLYLFRLHWQLYEKEEIRKNNPWINILAWRKLPLLEQQLSASSSANIVESPGMPSLPEKDAAP